MGKIGVTRFIRHLIRGGERRRIERQVLDHIAARCGRAVGLAIDRKINRPRIARPQNRCLCQRRHRVAFAGIEDFLEQNRAINGRHPHPGWPYRQNFHAGCGIGHHLHRSIAHGLGDRLIDRRLHRHPVRSPSSHVIRVDRGNRAIARGQHRHAQRLWPVEHVGATAGLRRLIRRGRTHQRRIALHIAQRIQFGHHGRSLVDRGQLHALDLLQHRPAAIAQRTDQGDQHRKRPYGTRFKLGKQTFALGYETRMDKRVAVFRRHPVARGLDHLTRGCRRHAMRHLEVRFLAEPRKTFVRLHPEITRIRPHIARDKTRRFKGRHIGILDRRDIRSFDLQLALHIQK